MRERIVEVDQLWLSQLKEYLNPEERFILEREGRNGIVLYDPMSTKLVFVSGKRMHLWFPEGNVHGLYVCQTCKQRSDQEPEMLKDCMPYEER